jgi:hypothetical protein
LSEGDYHFDVYLGSTLVDTVNFQIKVYYPRVEPPVATPAGHFDIEIPPWFTEIPFAFDEVWKIDGKDWKINEVKILLSYNTDEYWLTIIVNSDVDHTGLSESEVKELVRPIALYAIDNGYVERARDFEIDGKHYAFDQYIFVTLINLQMGNKYAVRLTMDELK